ncbi:MAG: T9SS type A sorting domain-containing protein [Saprospiraceae bacterium]|nr:T9SS type A sorting domain-containing protein [Saprospiraceae bacterium]
MRFRILKLSILLSIWCLYNVKAQTLRCHISAGINPVSVNAKPNLAVREKMQFQLVFHILYTTAEENISMGQIVSQVQVLNDIMNQAVVWPNPQIPAVFRSLKESPQFQFCLADSDPQGNPTMGVTRTLIKDLSIACKKEFGKRNLMHKSLGGVDIWDPKKYINIFIINRDQCPVLGEAIFPWNASSDEDGVIIHYKALGYTGPAADYYPFHQGKTLVHELGHYFGLLHLSNDRSDCNGDDEVEDTPTQANEYFGCPKYEAETCGNLNMFMNYMSLVEDGCMLLFTKAQINRMQQMIQTYRLDLPTAANCIPTSQNELTDVNGSFENGFWLLYHKDHKNWSADIELYDTGGKLIWQSSVVAVQYLTIPDLLQEMGSGLYFVILRDQKNQKVLKLFTN